MKRSPWTLACCLALLVSACAHRPSGTRLVYVASPPAANPATPEDSGTLVIEEPVTPEPEEPPPAAPAPASATDTQPQPRARRSPPPPAPPEAEVPLVEPPPLEPAHGAGQEGLRQSIVATQDDVARRVTQFGRRRHSDAEGRTADEAKAFLEQSRSALKEGDLPRAEKLADKARLLITALEKGP